MIENEDSMIVTVTDSSFLYIKEKSKYYSPKPIIIKLKYIFIYRVLPVSAITHYARVIKIIKNANEKLSLLEKMRFFHDPSKNAFGIAIGELKELTTPIKYTGKTKLQTRIYCNSESLFKMTNTQEIFNWKKKQKQIKNKL